MLPWKIGLGESGNPSVNVDTYQMRRWKTEYFITFLYIRTITGVCRQNIDMLWYRLKREAKKTDRYATKTPNNLFCFDLLLYSGTLLFVGLIRNLIVRAPFSYFFLSDTYLFICICCYLSFRIFWQTYALIIKYDSKS